MFTKNIVLTGFMGTGKSAVGRLLAEETGHVFIDTDQLIEQRAGRSISAIFEEQGESTFRALERQVALELAGRDQLVIATGGGMMLDPLNALRLAQNGMIVCLTAAPDEIVKRLATQAHDRPLLADPDPEQRIRNLMVERRAIYNQFLQFDTSGKTPTQASKTLLQAVERWTKQGSWARPLVSRLRVKHHAGQYEVVAGQHVLPELADLVHLGGPVAILTDANVGPLYAGQLGGMNPLAIITIAAGEHHKNLKTVQAIYDQLIAAGLDRHGTLISLGGGVVGDVGGFVAATYLRGIRVVHCPTTTLAMVDASLGGKCGVDLPQGKNLVGTFKQPEAVIADMATLATLPTNELAGGMAEVIKHGLIGATSYMADVGGHFRALHDRDSLTGQALLVEAMQVKQAIVEEDPFETGRRAVLNLGHTFAHAIEQASQYTVPHGQAVAIGLVAAARLSASLGYCLPQLVDQVEDDLAVCGLPTRLPIGLSPVGLLEAMGQDKKRAAGRPRFVLIRRPGDVFLSNDVPADAVRQTWQALVP